MLQKDRHADHIDKAHIKSQESSIIKSFIKYQLYIYLNNII